MNKEDTLIILQFWYEKQLGSIMFLPNKLRTAGSPTVSVHRNASLASYCGGTL